MADSDDSMGGVRVIVNTKVLAALFDVPGHVSSLPIFTNKLTVLPQIFVVPDSLAFRAGVRTDLLVSKRVRAPVLTCVLQLADGSQDKGPALPAAGKALYARL